MVDLLAIATIIMAGFVAYQAFLTRKSIEEMRKEKEFYLMREHTRKIKEKIVGPLLEEIKNNINIGTHDFRVYRRVSKFSHPPYNGEALPPENEHRVLFDDFMKNHATQTLVESYYKFKELARKINSAIDNLGKELEEFLKGKGLPLAEFSRLRDEERDKILKEHGWVVDKNSAIEFFMKYIYHKIRHPILKYAPAHANTPRRFIVEYKDNRGYWSGHLQCICDKERLDNNKLEFLEKLLIEAQDKFAADVETIREYVTQFNEVRNALILELKRMEVMEIYKEKCEFVRFP